jgi:hypothetical protein
VVLEKGAIIRELITPFSSTTQLSAALGYTTDVDI